MTPASRSGGNTTRTTQASPRASPKATATPTTAHAACPQRRKVASHPCSVMSDPFSRPLQLPRAGAPDDAPVRSLPTSWRRRPPSVHQRGLEPVAGVAATHSVGSRTLGASPDRVAMQQNGSSWIRSRGRTRTRTRSDEHSRQVERDADDGRRPDALDDAGWSHRRPRREQRSGPQWRWHAPFALRSRKRGNVPRRLDVIVPSAHVTWRAVR